MRQIAMMYRTIPALLVIGVALVGCGAGATGSQSASPHTTAPKSTTTSATEPVKLGTATVSGKSEPVLVNTNGYTVYYFTKDTPAASHCTGSCAALWPAVLASSTKIQTPSGLSGTLSVVADANGNQVAYNGHLLYVYSGDKKTGQALGQGLLKEWWVATPSLTAPSSTSSGYGY